MGLFSCYCCLLAKSYLTLCNPMACSMPSSCHSLLHKFTSVESVILSTISSSATHFCCLQSFPASGSFLHIRFSCLHIRWPKYWSFSISPSNEYSRLISFRMDWLDLLAVQGTLRVFSSITIRKHQFFSAQPSLWSNSHMV